MNLLEQIARHLAFCGLGRADGDIFWGRMPDQPDDCIGVFSTDGGADEADARIQILNRASEPKRAYETACRIARALDGFQGFLAGDGAMARITAESTAAGLGTDVKKRELYAANIRAAYCAEEQEEEA